MRIAIDDIKVGTRIRTDVGDISELRESIQKIGLINPVVVNQNNELLSGLRRLEACSQLGWSEIEVVRVDTDSDKLKELDFEYHENIGRRNLKEDEIYHYYHKREALQNQKKSKRGFLEFFNTIWSAIKRFIVRIFSGERRFYE